MSEIEVSQCPFCGSDEASPYMGEPGPGVVKCWAVGCGAEIGGFATDEEAIEAWNRRAALSNEVGVKALEWHFDGENTQNTTGICHYKIEHFEAGGFGVYLHGYVGLHGDPIETLDEAKATAQANYEKRIRAALTNKNEMPNPAGSQIRTAQRCGMEDVSVTGQPPVGTASPIPADRQSEPVAWRYKVKGEYGWSGWAIEKEVSGLHDYERNKPDSIIIEPLYTTQPAVTVPDGWQLVPKEPTFEMAKAAIHLDPKSDLDAKYRAMLAAAPRPPHSAERDDLIKTLEKMADLIEERMAIIDELVKALEYAADFLSGRIPRDHRKPVYDTVVSAIAKADGRAPLSAAPESGKRGGDLLTAIKEWGRWHHLNEMTIAAKKTPSDSEIEFEVEAWTKIERTLSLAATEPVKVDGSKLRAACQVTSVNWTLSGEQVFRLYQQVNEILASAKQGVS